MSRARSPELPSADVREGSAGRSTSYTAGGRGRGRYCRERDHAREAAPSRRELNEAEVETALVRLAQERNAVQERAQTTDATAVEDAWSLANAREAIRQEPW